MQQSGVRAALLAVAAVFVLSAAVPLVSSDGSDANPLTQEEEYYYNQLDLTERGLYRQIYGAALSFQESVDTGLDFDTLKETAINVLSAVRYDHPELYYLAGEIAYNSRGTVTLTFSVTESVYRTEIAEIEEAAAAMVSGISENRYLAVKQLHDQIIKKTAYDEDADNAHNISGVFLDGKAVCEGYGLALCYLCDMLDIPCIAVVGEASSDGEDFGGHMWNYVQMGEQWFAVDVTWDDSSYSILVSTAYLLVGSETVVDGYAFSESHVKGDLSTYVDVPELQESKYTSTTGENTGPVYGEVPSYYRDTLTEAQQTAYDIILEAVLGFEEKAETGIKSADSLVKAYYAVYYDRPDLFYMSGSFSYDAGKGTVVLDNYTCTESEYKSRCAKILTSVSGLEADLTECDTVYTRVLAIHDWICKNVTYSSNDEDQNIYGALGLGNAVCAGYGRSLQYLCYLYGVDVMSVTGRGQDEAHLWNIVLMNDGKWYDMDVTWDDGGSEVYYRDFLVGSETVDVDGKTFAENHILYKLEDGTLVPSFSYGRLPDISASSYPIRPGQEMLAEIPSTVTSDGDTGIGTVTLSDLQSVYDLTQGVGDGIISIGDYGRVRLSMSSLALLIQYMEDNSLTEVSFSETDSVRSVKVGPLERDNDVHTFAFLVAGSEIPISHISADFSVTLYIPYQPSALDFLTFLIFAWDVEDPTVPVEGSDYSDGYVRVPASAMGHEYIVGSTPVKDLPVTVVLGGVLLVILAVYALVKHHREKKLYG